MTNTLLYITFKDYPELGRMKIVKDDFKFDKHGCKNCACYSDSLKVGWCSLKQHDEGGYVLPLDWLVCGAKSHHFEASPLK